MRQFTTKKRYVNVAFASVLLILFLRAGSAATDIASIRLQAEHYFMAHERNGDFSGTVVLAQHGEIVYEGSFGTIEPGSKDAITSATRFAIASLTKTLTSGTILVLEQKGMLNRDDRLSKYLPEFPRGEEITLRQLLLHASGVGNPNTSELEREGWITLERLVDHLMGLSLLFEPGSRYQYSNGGYNVLARVIEMATGQDYGRVVGETILDPLEMQATEDGAVVPRPTSISAGTVPGPGPAKRIPAAAPNLYLSSGSGSILSTARDMTRWAYAFGSAQFFDPEQLEWPYGWGKLKDHGGGYEQTGAITGFMSVMRVYPESGWTIVVLSSTEYGRWSEWGSHMAELIFEETVPVPKAWPEPRSLTGEEITNAVGRYRNGDDTYDVRQKSGHLWIYWNDYSTGKYLQPVGDSNLFRVRADWFDIEFSDLAGGLCPKLTQLSPDGDKIFARSSAD